MAAEPIPLSRSIIAEPHDDSSCRRRLAIRYNVAMKFISLQSGSNGNCYFVQAGEVRLLIDAGISAQLVRRRLAQFGEAPQRLDAILISHDHHDHSRSMGVFQRQFSAPLFVTEKTLAAVPPTSPASSTTTAAVDHARSTSSRSGASSYQRGSARCPVADAPPSRRVRLGHAESLRHGSAPRRRTRRCRSRSARPRPAVHQRTHTERPHAERRESCHRSSPVPRRARFRARHQRRSHCRSPAFRTCSR